MFDLNEIFKNKEPGFIGQENKTYSIVVPVIEIDGDQHLIFQVRNKRLKVQPGEVSFPGGQLEEGETPYDAAIREFSEEMSCSPDQVKIITELDTYVAPGRGLIHCFLAEIDKNFNLDIKNDEEECLFTLPISYFLENEPLVLKNTVRIEPSPDFPFEEMNIPESYHWGSYKYPISFYKIGEIVIWGITANIVNSFSKKLI